jgi:hypothetical protein
MGWNHPPDRFSRSQTSMVFNRGRYVATGLPAVLTGLLEIVEIIRPPEGSGLERAVAGPIEPRA